MSGNTFKTKKIVLGGLFAALITLVTYLAIRIPGGSGYIHLGDSVIFVAAFVLGGLGSAAAAAVGSALTDIILGFAIYAPGTFVIKGLTALVAAMLMKAFKPKLRILAILIASLIIPIGYFAYELSFITTFEVAIVNIPFNLLQTTVGSIVGYALTIALEKTALKNS
ncbi:MAG: ECF transporter S component [Clostridiales bacterium]|nr:ECF transporter S component [Clostridiales bacterium]